MMVSYYLSILQISALKHQKTGGLVTDVHLKVQCSYKLIRPMFPLEEKNFGIIFQRSERYIRELSLQLLTLSTCTHWVLGLGTLIFVLKDLLQKQVFCSRITIPLFCFIALFSDSMVFASASPETGVERE